MNVQDFNQNYFSIDALKNGDRAAFAIIFKSLYPYLCRYAFQFVKSSEAAEEIAEDSFVAMWKDRDKLASLQHLKSYLYNVTRNKSLNFIEHSVFENRKSQEWLVNAGIDKGDSLMVIYNDVLQQLYDAIEELPEQCRKVMTMTFKGGKKVKEIAASMDVKESTVRNQQARGISILKKRFLGDSMIMLILILSKEV